MNDDEEGNKVSRNDYRVKFNFFNFKNLDNKNDIPYAELDSELCDSDNEIFEKKKGGRLKKKAHFTDDIVDEENKESRKKFPEAKMDNADEVGDDFIRKPFKAGKNKSLAHEIFLRNKITEDKIDNNMQDKSQILIVPDEYEGEYISAKDIQIVNTDIPERLLIRYFNK